MTPGGHRQPGNQQTDWPASAVPQEDPRRPGEIPVQEDYTRGCERERQGRDHEIAVEYGQRPDSRG